MDETSKLSKIKKYISDYMVGSQMNGRGSMYGSLETLEQNWIILDHISDIMEDFDERKECDFATFLTSKGFGAKSASMVIYEKEPEEPYSELNHLWNEYKRWKKKITKVRTESDLDL